MSSRSFFVNGNEVKRSCGCPAGYTTCLVFDYFKQTWPKTHYNLQDGQNVSTHISGVQNPLAVQIKIQSLCDECGRLKTERVQSGTTKVK